MDISTEKQEMDASESLETQRETFVASLSHDLKNPTIAQIRALELILRGRFGEIQPRQREIMEMILDSCKYMNAMLSSLLTTYRNQMGSVVLENNEVSISDLAVECVDEIIYLAKDKGVKVSISNTTDDGIVYGDRVQLKRVVMNLLTNAVKYAFSNTELFVQIFNSDNNVCFQFKNSSPYIIPEKQAKIFARYVTFAQAHQEFGTGLGLYASKKIVEAHGGKMYVKSYKENINIFGFKIPTKKPDPNTKRTVTF